MIDSKYETHNKAGLLSASNLLVNFSLQIINIKKMAPLGGVDLAREERVKNCEQIIESLF